MVWCRKSMWEAVDRWKCNFSGVALSWSFLRLLWWVKAGLWYLQGWWCCLQSCMVQTCCPGEDPHWIYSAVMQEWAPVAKYSQSQQAQLTLCWSRTWKQNIRGKSMFNEEHTWGSPWLCVFQLRSIWCSWTSPADLACHETIPDVLGCMWGDGQTFIHPLWAWRLTHPGSGPAACMRHI